LNAIAPITANPIAPPPCYFWNICGQRAAIEKTGRSVCRHCSENMRGAEYPLRGPSLQPLYLTGRAVAEAMNIFED
jgi:hypothetical protein